MTGQHYTTATAELVERIFRDVEAAGRVVTVRELVQRTTLSRKTVSRVLHDAPWWTTAHATKARSSAARREITGDALARGRRTQAEAGYPGLRKGHATQAALGYPNLAGGRVPGPARPGGVVQSAANVQALRDARARAAALGYPALQKGRQTLAARAAERRQHILEALRQLATPSQPLPSYKAIARQAGVSRKVVERALYRLRRDGLLAPPASRYQHTERSHP